MLPSLPWLNLGIWIKFCLLVSLCYFHILEEPHFTTVFRLLLLRYKFRNLKWLLEMKTFLGYFKMVGKKIIWGSNRTVVIRAWILELDRSLFHFRPSLWFWANYQTCQSFTSLISKIIISSKVLVRSKGDCHRYGI